ncbi:MAG: FtsX-like permease family protein, partial [Bacteroides sp.]|nr:FtsX-like permease family protein [Bacteroides sp.]
AEVEQMLRINSIIIPYLQYQGHTLTDVTFAQTDSTLLSFFDYTAKEGSLKEALTVPDQVALSASFARRLFGERSGIGEQVETVILEGKKRTYRVAAVLEDRPQSLLQFDMLTAISPDYSGGPTLLRLKEGTDVAALTQKIKDDKVPTLLPGQTHYYIDPVKDIYFTDNANGKPQPMPAFFHHTNVQQLYIALVSALLALVIACFNYSNLNFSRTLQQLKMIHIEKLMGAKLKEIRMQLFLDAVLTVTLAFLLSVLLINDILPLFNKLLHTRLDYGFFFSGQVLPLLLGFALLLAIVPGVYISHRLSRQTLSEYREQYAGRGKQRIVQILVTLQFMLSFALVYATTVAQSQMKQIEERAFRYENLIEVGDMMSGPRLQPLLQQLAERPEGIEAITLSSNSVLTGFLAQHSVTHPDGTEERFPVRNIDTDASFFSTLNIRIIEGLSPTEAIEKYGRSFYLNEHYARLKGITSEDIGQKTLKDVLPWVSAESILGGIIEDYPTQSLEKETVAQLISTDDAGSTYLGQVGKYLQIRLQPEKREATLKRIEQAWKEMFDGQEFIYLDIHQQFMELNEDITLLGRILNTYSLIALVLTCFGVFGISWYAVRQRTKEIAIRKIHGASPLHIVWLLNRPFLLQIVAAYIIAMPVTWYIMQGWLETFVYRPQVTALHFILPLLVVLAVSVLTVSVHSWLAARVNPINSLKTE